MEPGEYAERAVLEITQGQVGKFWFGLSPGVVKFAVEYPPTWLMVNAPDFLLPHKHD